MKDDYEPLGSTGTIIKPVHLSDDQGLDYLGSEVIGP